MRIKPYVLIFKSNVSKEMCYRFNFIFGSILQIIKLLVCLTVWSVIFKDHDTINNYSWNEMASYYAVSMVAIIFFLPRSFI